MHKFSISTKLYNILADAFSQSIFPIYIQTTQKQAIYKFLYK